MHSSLSDIIQTYAVYILTYGFAALLIYTLARLLIVMFDTSTASEKQGPKQNRLWLIFVWFILAAPFAALIYMIVSRDPEMDKAIKERAFKSDTQQSKRIPLKPRYSESESK